MPFREWNIKKKSVGFIFLTLAATPSQVPPYARVAFANMIALVWNVVLSI